MKTVAGALFILAGMVLGFYVGIMKMFVPGIIGIIEAIKSNPISSTGIAFGIVKIIFAGCVGVVVSLIPISTGYFLIKND